MTYTDIRLTALTFDFTCILFAFSYFPCENEQKLYFGLPVVFVVFWIVYTRKKVLNSAAL